jgi:hypothetical protein
MGAETMRITVVGAILIVATVMASLLLLLALNENKSRLVSKQEGGFQEDQSWQDGIGA